MSDQDHTDNAADDALLTKQKKPRSDAQKAAFLKAQAVNAAKKVERDAAAAKGIIDPEKQRKKLILIALREKLNGEPKSKPVQEEPEDDDEDEEDEPPVVAPKKKAVKSVAPLPTPVEIKKKKSKPIPEPVEESSESEEEIIVVKKKRKPKKKTIIYEESSSEEEEIVAPPKKVAGSARDTKSQMNKSMFKVTASKSEPVGPVYYFAD
jgi:hypothetical protein